MSKLLVANFHRLLKSKIFGLGISIMFIFGIIVTIARKRDGDILGAEYGKPDGLLFIGATYFLITAAIFVSLFIGDEHADGTWRNKIIVGHGRTQIYMSYLIVTTVASLLIHLSYIVSVLVGSAICLGSFQTPFKINFILFLCSLVTVIAINSIMVSITMLSRNKRITVVFCMLIALILMMGGVYIYQILSAPEILTGPPSVINGQIVYPESMSNPKHITGTKRAILQFLHDFLPGGQMITIGMTNELPQSVWKLPVYSVILSLLCSTCGISGFIRRDLK